jgi:inositol 1,4,5-triphosphate receptor type 1
VAEGGKLSVWSFKLRFFHLSVRDLDFANDASKVLSNVNKKIRDGTVSRNDLSLLRKLLTDVIYFVAEAADTGGDCLDVPVGPPNREKQKLLREQNILKQVQLVQL